MALAAAHPVYAITSSSTSVVKGIFAEYGVRVVVEVLVGKQEASKTRKIRSARRRHWDDLPAWYVCDTVGDASEAREAGVGTVGVAWGWHGEERLRRVTPDRMANAPGDLLDLFWADHGSRSIHGFHRCPSRSRCCLCWWPSGTMQPEGYSAAGEGGPMSLGIEVDQAGIADFCRRSRIRRLSFFGSVLRDDFRPESDVDVLVEFDPDAVVGYFAMARMERELGELFARRVDFRTPQEISRHFRDKVLEEAQETYVA